MTNWFYMDRMTFTNLLNDELGSNLTSTLIELDFDHPVSFLIGKTSEEVLMKIQQTFSRDICGKITCHNECVFCSLNPSTYAKLIWFVRRLLIMSPLREPVVKQVSLPNENCSSLNDNVAPNNLQIYESSKFNYATEKKDANFITQSNGLNGNFFQFPTIVLCGMYFINIFLLCLVIFSKTT